MARRRKVCTWLTVTVVAAFGLCWGGVALAKTLMPLNVDDVVGVYASKKKVMRYDLTDGSVQKFTYLGMYEFTKVDDTTVNVHYEGDEATWDEHYLYNGGVLMGGIADDDVLGSYGYTEYIALKGKPGKLKGKKEWLQYDSDTLLIGANTLKQVQ